MVLALVALAVVGPAFAQAELESIRTQAAVLRASLELSRERLKPLKRLPGRLDLRVGITRPAGPVAGDILFIHGFADRLDNHGPLFQELSAAGFRVVSFDLPGHGENRGGLQNSLDLQSFAGLASIAVEVERRTREDASRPLLLAGWSTGGLLAVRIAQEDAFRDAGRKPRALILFTPGVAVHPLLGRHGIVTDGTLTQNPAPPHHGGIPLRNRSPLLHPAFAARFLVNAFVRSRAPLPSGLPTLIFLGGDAEDRYADSPRVREWALRQRAGGATILGLQCAGGFHELDNEDDPARGLTIGREVRAAAAAFARGVVFGPLEARASSSCRPF